MALWKSVGNGTLEGISRIADLDVRLFCYFGRFVA